MKKSKTAYDFFDGRLSDRKNSVRLYGFDEAVQQKLADHRDNGESVLLSNCEVKQNLRRKARILKSRSGALCCYTLLRRLRPWQAACAATVRQKSRIKRFQTYGIRDVTITFLSVTEVRTYNHTNIFQNLYCKINCLVLRHSAIILYQVIIHYVHAP